MENKEYIAKRERLIPFAIMLTNTATKGDPDKTKWDRVFINIMDKLAFENGIQAARFHKEI